ncbi:MAG: amino acid adenylation domain-containing protein [Desmonostoc geniculatum HA4340-LM1]|jgi:amino acid adenylation domain-containing protein|nr:amino acid adenylation domain-containing protein [Desmonostoc geniculatum HA4340-LM1]
MKVVEFLSYLNSLDIKIWLEEDKLRYQSPKGAMTTEIKQEIGTRKPEILAFLKQAKTPSSSADLAIVPVSRDEDLPLSFAQQRLWFLHQLSPDSHSYNMLEALRLNGSLNIVALEQSLSELVRRHEVLRTTFPTVDGNPIQRIAPATALTLPIHDLQGLSAQEQTTQIRQIGKSQASKPFDLAVGPLVEFTLLQLSPEEYVLLLKMHHIIYDGWSLSIFFSELSQLYAAFTQGLPNPLPELPIQYADFAFWQRQWLSGSVLESQLNYWEQQLAGAPGVLELATDKPRPPMQSFRGAAEFFLLNRDLTQRLKQLSQQSETTLFMTLLAAFLVLLSRYSGQSDIVVGSPIANRNSKSVEQLMGFFANTLALRGDLSSNPSFAEFLAQVRQTTLSAYAHQDLPFEMLVEKLQPERDLSRNPLVQVMFSLQNAPQSSTNLSGLNIQNIALPIDIKARFDLEVNFWETPGGLEGTWCYNTDLFDATTITRIAQHFETLLQAIVANPRGRVFELPLLSPAERHQLLVEWNNTQTDYPHDLCIHQLFEEQVEKTPDAVAVVYEDEQLTYYELNCRANQLAHYLRSLGVGASELVGICVERSPLMIVGLLGILKAGGAYVPLDPEYPQERQQFMLADTQVKVLLTQQKLLESVFQHQAHVVCLDSDWQVIHQANQDNLNSIVSAENLAYVIYTSGSTGTPKGVVVTHQAVNRLVKNTNYVQLTPDDCVAQAANIAFDAATFEIWGALLSGAKVAIVPKSILLIPKEFAVNLRSYKVSVLFLTTALFNQLASVVPQAFASLKYLLFGGEAVDPRWVQQVLDKGAPQHLLHVYGPTENTTFSSWYLVEDLATTATTIPIGRPIANTQIYIFDQYLQPVPVGVPGELHIGGVGLARGYLNRSELTNQKFIPNPFTAGESKLYKTGDLVRYLPDGNIEYIGRIDNQVKIRGFRIELGEIEAILSQHEDVQVSCVIVREDTPGEKRLVAYVVPQKGVTLTTEELRQFLTNKLPLYMVPSAFVILESLPLTPNGKVDHRALRAISNTDNFKKFVQPRNQLELQLVQIWSKVLKVNKVGVQDNFFDLGGHSLLAAYLMAQIQEQFGKNLPLTTLFQNPTIEQLATIVQKDSDYSDSSCLVPIQPKGSNSPFFCVPGAPGSPYYFYYLGRYLGVDQPLYGFENNLYELRLLSRLEDIASHYIQAMQAVQPQGPYFLGGHSYGGNVVFEMAQQLVAQGHEVALLAVIDASPSTYKDKQLLADYVDWDDVRWLAEVSKGIKLYLDKNIDVSYDTLQNLTMDEQLKYVLDYFKMANMLPPNAQITQLQNLVQAYKTSCLCLVNYQSKQIYPGKITIVRANEDLPDDPNSHLIAEDSQDLSLGWSEFCFEVDIQFVLGNHITIMAEPHVQVLAERLKACIEKARE